MSRTTHGFLRASLAAACLLVGISGRAALAQESSQELALGGLAMTRPPELTVDAQEVSVSPEQVVVTYRFNNTGAAPVQIMLRFPMPDLDFADPDVSYAIPAPDPVNFVGLRAKADGKPVAFTLAQRALLNNRDITAAVRKAGLDLIPIGTFQNKLAAMTPEAQEALANDGLLAQAGTNAEGAPLYFPTWAVKTSATRRHSFAPGPSTIEIRYRTSLGMSRDTVMRAALRRNKQLEQQVADYKATYCTDEGFLNGVDKLAGTAEANAGKLGERRIRYNLQADGAWSGPIKDFKLTVAKGRADRVVSFCFDNLSLVAPNTFQFKAVDYVPDRDLRVLLIGRF